MSVRRIAITQRIVEAQGYEERRDALAHDWHIWCRRTFPMASLIPVPNDPECARQWFAEVRPDAVLLSNGNDWGEYVDRDETEFALVRLALSASVPLLGVCRGLQVLNLFFGGSLFQDLDTRPSANRHVAASHTVHIDSDWPLLLGVPERLDVNSYHHHGIVREGLAPDLRALGCAPDGVVEAAYHPQHAVLGIQWHPERPGTPSDFDDAMIIRFFEEGMFWK